MEEHQPGTAIQLFSVSTVVSQYRGCKNVPFSWFKEKPERGARPYPQLIDG
jgi:hypothetical protein